MYRKVLPFLIIIMYIVTMTKQQIEVDNWKFHFPTGSTMGFFLAVALPLELKNNAAYLAYNFEANYLLPNGQNHLEYPPLLSRDGKGFDRKFVYEAIESKLKMMGYSNAKGCLLRTICEASCETVKGHNGVLGDILHIIFTPSSSTNVNVTNDYYEAEKAGQAGECKNYYRNCSISLFGLITWVKNSY